MGEIRCYPTGWANLWYRNDGTDANQRWRFIDARTRLSIGPVYKTRVDLLASVRPFAITHGFHVKDDRTHKPEDILKIADYVPPVKGAAESWEQSIGRLLKIPGATVVSFWNAFWALYKPAKPAPGQEDAMRDAFFAGFWAMAEAAHRMGDEDVSADGAVRWLGMMLRECKEHKPKKVT